MAALTVSFILLALIAGLGSAASPGFTSPAYPLAVKTPYVNAWLHGDLAYDVPTAEPQFWAQQTLGWHLAARVDGSTYYLLGFPDGLDGARKAVQRSISLTATHTHVTLQAGDASIDLDFFSPVSPTDYIRSSLPFSYLTVSASAAGSDVQILSATDERWSDQVGQVHTTLATAGSTSYFSLFNPNQNLFGETDEAMAQWGTFVHASQPNAQGSLLTVQCGTAANVTSTFVARGRLSGKSTACPTSGTVGLSHDLGTVYSKTSAVFAVGLQQNKAINFLGNAQAPYYMTQYPGLGQALDAFFDDYPAAVAESASLDQTILDQGNQFGSDYADILELGVRQVFAAGELTIPPQGSVSDAWLFVKEISSDGNVNTVDVLYPTFPIWYSLNPNLIKLSLEPILAYVNTPGVWTENFTIHDIGTHFPNAIRHAGEPEFMPVQSTTNALILAYAYHHATGDATWANHYRATLLTWADYLLEHGDAREVQLASVDAIPASANQTQLAASSAVALACVGKMFGLDRYTSAGQQLADALFSNGLGLSADRSHFTYNYPSSSAHDTTWSPFPPLFIDRLLETNVFPDAALSIMSGWYSQHFHTFGLPYREVPNPTGQAFGIIDWNMWSAAVSSPAVRNQIISTTHLYLTDGKSDLPFQTKYNVNSGEPLANIARSTVGANWALALLALNVTDSVVQSSNEGGGGLLGGL